MSDAQPALKCQAATFGVVPNNAYACSSADAAAGVVPVDNDAVETGVVEPKTELVSA